MSKKLIEVTLPLEAINAEAAREKSIRHGHPSTLHLWWARRPLAAARAVIWSSLVDDPSAHPELYPTEETQNAERQRLFTILEKLVKWKTPTTRRCWTPPKRRSCALPITTRRPCWIPLRAAVPSRWKPSGWGWKPTPTT